MSQVPSTSGLLRVTVASGTRRVDLVVPGAVPVAELVPELARSVGLLDGATVYGGYHLLSQDGRELSNDTGLIVQGVEDGGLLTVTAGIDDEAPRVYDDVVEAMAVVVERDLRPWQPASGRRTALVAAALMLALGAGALLSRPSTVSALAAAVVAAVLVTGAVVLSRAQAETEAAASVGWLGAGYAAAAGLVIPVAGPGPGLLAGLPVDLAGLGALLAGLVCLVGVREGRALALPPVVVGAVLLGAGLLVRLTSFDPAVVLSVLLVAVVTTGSVLPWLALSATGTTVDQMYSAADITADPEDVDADRVGADARTAHEILLAVSGTVGVLLLLLGPVAASLGPSGTLLAVTCCLVVMLRTRQYRTGAAVLVGLGSGVLGLAATVAAALWLHPEWRSTAALVLAVTGSFLLALTLVPSTPSVRRGRLGDLLESVALVSLLPLLVVASGAFSAVQGF